MKIVFLGLPGSGKTTLGKLLAEAMALPHASIGDMARRAVTEKTDIGLRILAEQEAQGGKAPLSDELAAEIAHWVFAQNRSWIIDGYPRTVEQAMGMDPPDIVIHLKVPAEICIARMGERKRDDDGTETPQQRVAIDGQRLPDLVEFCRTHWKIIEIDSSGRLEESWKRLKERCALA